jgi:hypothetical protein
MKCLFLAACVTLASGVAVAQLERQPAPADVARDRSLQPVPGSLDVPRTDEPHAVHCPPEQPLATERTSGRQLPVGTFGSALSNAGTTQTQPR